MSNYKKTIVLGLDYSEFSGGITECNRKMGLLDAEMKLATEQAKNYGTETDQLSIKKDTLSQKIELQKKVVEENRRAYEKAIESGTATEKQTDSLNKKYIDSQTNLERLNGEYNTACNELKQYTGQQKKTEEQVDQTEEKNRSFGDTIRGVSSMLGLQASPAVEAFASRFDGVDEKVGLAIVTIGALTAKLVDCSKSAAKYADDVLTMSTITGLSTDTLQKMNYAAELVDVSTDQISTSMSKMVKNMNNAREGNETLQKAFRNLNVTYTDSNNELRNAEDVFYDVIDAMGKMENETERDAVAMEIFGRSAKELNPLIEAGSERLRELGEEAESVGYVMSGDNLGKLGAFDDAMQRLENTSGALKNTLGLALAPVLTAIFNAIAAIPAPVLATMVTLTGAIATVLLIVEAIEEAKLAGGRLIKFFQNFDLKALKTTGIILGVVAALIALGTIITVIMGKANDLGRAMNTMNNGVKNVNASVNSAQKRYNARGTNYFEGGETWVGEHGPERVMLPTGSRIYSNQDSRQSEVNNYYITIDAKNVDDFNRVVKIVDGVKQAKRKSG